MTIDEDFQKYGKQDFSWRAQLICMKIEAHSSSEPPVEYNQDQAPLRNQDWSWPFYLTWKLREDYVVSH